LQRSTLDNDVVEYMSVTEEELMNSQIHSITEECKNKIDEMTGSWVIPKNGYEKSFCNLLGWDCVSERWSDAHNANTHIEIKKGQDSMWFDMVRYAEIFHGLGRQNTVTVFIRYDKKQEYVREIYIIDTKVILRFLKLTDETSNFCMRMHQNTHRSLNMQASATSTDMRSMASIIIRSKRELERASTKRTSRKRRRADPEQPNLD
jgi:hypothetical protein